MAETDTTDPSGHNPARLKTAKEYVREKGRQMVQEHLAADHTDHDADERRKEIREVPADYQFAILSDDLATFAREASLPNARDRRRYAIVLDVSPGGCSLVLEIGAGQDPAFPAMLEEYVVQLGASAPRRAVVRWRGNISDTLINAGFEFLD
jgi:hypothetical protein